MVRLEPLLPALNVALTVIYPGIIAPEDMFNVNVAPVVNAVAKPLSMTNIKAANVIKTIFLYFIFYLLCVLYYLPLKDHNFSCLYLRPALLSKHGH